MSAQAKGGGGGSDSGGGRGGRGGGGGGGGVDAATILERLPQDLRAHVLELSGGAAWHRGVRSANRALRRLCETKGMCDAVRRLAMGEFKRGMDLWKGTNGAVEDRQAGKALVMRAAAAGLRPAIAYCFYEVPHQAKAAALWQAELDDSASETEASGGACCWSAYWLAECYARGVDEEGHGVERDEARALELYTHAAETDENGKAMEGLHYVYRFGLLQGQAVDHARAVSWLRKSAASGYCDACCRLGGVLQRGELGVDVDLKEALRYYEKAAKQRPRSHLHTDAIARVRAAIAAQSDSNGDAEA